MKDKTTGANNRFKKLRGEVLYAPLVLFITFTTGGQVSASKTANS